MACIWKTSHLEVETTILRPCNVIGPLIQNAITKYLRMKNAPLPIDYNPCLQFIHELDFVDILLKAVSVLPPDVYNVASDEFITLKEAKKLAGRPTFPVPIFLLGPAAKILKKTFWGLPDYLLDYMKYPCIIDNSRLKQALGGHLELGHSIRSTLQNL
jgi:UDP-glucose 4-epimerase